MTDREVIWNKVFGNHLTPMNRIMIPVGTEINKKVSSHLLGLPDFKILRDITAVLIHIHHE